jgi:predicted DCC family thiol-disulfide oxidoreductase YuxK
MESPSLTLYFDCGCPTGMAAVRLLRSWDQHGRLRFIDIKQPDFDPTSLGVSFDELASLPHGWTADGRCVTGVDSIVAACTLVGKGRWVMPLRMPVARPAFRIIYRSLARNRQRIFRWFGLKPRPTSIDQGGAGPFS